MLLSRASGARGAKADDVSYGGRLSANGRFVAFDSWATNLSAADRAASDRDVYVRDRVTHSTTLVSRATGVDETKGDGYSFDPYVSEDGRFVAFTSNARNLSPDDHDAKADVFVRDLKTLRTTLVSRASGADGARGDRGSTGGALSADGRFVVFSSKARNLVRNDRAVRDVSCAISRRPRPRSSVAPAARAACKETANPSIPSFRPMVDSWRSSRAPTT
jgi:hypothetical protein